mgnify:CR=1 FL=1
MVPEQDCVHHWLLGDAAPIIPGVCRLCGATRNFSGDMYDTVSEGSLINSISRFFGSNLKRLPKTVDGDNG